MRARQAFTIVWGFRGLDAEYWAVWSVGNKLWI